MPDCSQGRTSVSWVQCSPVPPPGEWDIPPWWDFSSSLLHLISVSTSVLLLCLTSVLGGFITGILIPTLALLSGHPARQETNISSPSQERRDLRGEHTQRRKLLLKVTCKVFLKDLAFSVTSPCLRNVWECFWITFCPLFPGSLWEQREWECRTDLISL